MIKLRKTLGLHNDEFDEKSKVLKLILSSNECDTSNKWHFSLWGLWLRVSNCSNHSNSYFLTKFSKTTQKVLKQALKVQINDEKSIRRKCVQRIDHLVNILPSSKHNL